MTKEFDELEYFAYRQAGVAPGTKRGQISDEQRKSVDNYIYNGVRRNPSLYSNDPRASKYLKNTSFEDRQAMAQRELRDSVNPGDVWNDWGTGGAAGQPLYADDDTPEYYDDSDDGQTRWQDKQDNEEPEGEPAEGDESEPSEEPTEEKPKPENNPDEEKPAEEPGIGEDAQGAANNAKSLGKTEEAAEGAATAGRGAAAATGAGEGAAAAAGAAEGATAAAGAAGAAGAAAEGAAVAAGGGAVAAGTVSGVLPILIAVVAIVAFFLLIGVFVVISWGNTEEASATTTTGNGATTSLISKACSFAQSVKAAGCVDKVTCAVETLYNSVRQKDFSDCYGFVVTSAIESGVIPETDISAAVAPRASDAIASYYSKHPEKYEIIGPITSTKQLQPGDMLFNTRTGSHATIYIGDDYCDCKTNSLSASLNTHGPQCSSWYSDMQWAVRLK